MSSGSSKCTTWPAVGTQEAKSLSDQMEDSNHRLYQVMLKHKVERDVHSESTLRTGYGVSKVTGYMNPR